MPLGLRLVTCLPKQQQQQQKQRGRSRSISKKRRPRLDESTTAQHQLPPHHGRLFAAAAAILQPLCFLLLVLGVASEGQHRSSSSSGALPPLPRFVRDTPTWGCELECERRYAAATLLNATAAHPPPCPIEELTSRPPRLRTSPLLTCYHIPIQLMFNDTSTCNIDEWRQAWNADRRVCRYVCEMNNIFKRFDCQHPYSVRWSCHDCKTAYLEWICAMELKLYVNQAQVKPCRQLCTHVEERCPHFNPPQREQYAGEPLFYCIDPAIPDDLPIMDDVRYGPPGNCITPCQLNASRIDNHNNNTGAAASSSEECHVVINSGSALATRAVAASTIYTAPASPLVVLLLLVIWLHTRGRLHHSQLSFVYSHRPSQVT